MLLRTEKHDYIVKYISFHIAAPNESPLSKKKALDALFGDSFTQRERKSTNETAREEVIRYREKDALPLTENAMKYWRSHKKQLPLLSATVHQHPRHKCASRESF